MPYPEFKQPLDYAALARQMREFWERRDIFRQSVESRPAENSFVFYEGPPSANGTPGIHHVMARTVKDIFCRYQTLRGKRVERKGGWDTHGLPVELQVEKELGITKEDIGKTISVEEYNHRCRETVMRFKGEWDELTQQMGYWVDLDKPYITFEPEYIESCWALLKRLYNKGLLYKGYTIQPYSPAAGTGLSSHELNQPGTYRDVKDTTVVAMFRVNRDERSEALLNLATEAGADNLFILAWTTTPWTLPANTALAVGAGIRYSVVRTFNPYTHQPVVVVLAADLVSRYFNPKGEGDEALATYPDGDKKTLAWKTLREVKGMDLIGLRYEQLFQQVQPENVEKAFRVIPGDFVTTEDGTGVVHISPTFGADDFRAAQLADVPALLVRDDEGKLTPIVDRTGKYVPQMGEWAGRYVKNYQGTPEAAYHPLDVDLAVDLKQRGRAFKVEKYEHPYPHCWRTDKPVLYYPLDSWFIRTTAVKDRLIELNNTINWKPESTGTGRFGNWLENLVDWNLSRSRYWGTPLPIWRTQDGQEEICIGSVAELRTEIQKAVQAGVMDHDPLPHPPTPSPAGRGSDEPRTIANTVITTTPERWAILKEHARLGRKQPTEAENALWEELRGQKLGYKFRRQHAIERFVVDFVNLRTMLVVEVDGGYHNTPEQAEYDQTRTEVLESLGYQVIRFANEEVLNDRVAVLKKITQTLAEREPDERAENGSPAPTGGGGRGVGVDLHRPYVDEIVLVSPSGKPMYRETDLIDVWFDSGAMPYAQWHYPHENEQKFRQNYPADFIAEGVDQTRGWFFTLHALAVMLEDSVAFKNVIANGLVLDKDGNKMSKRLGNAIDPFQTIAQYGPDATRWYMIANAPPWENLKFDPAGIVEVQRRFFGTLFNTYAFFALYANLDGFQTSKTSVPVAERPELDRWILSKLHSLVGEVRGHYDAYDPTKAARAVQDFVTDQLSNWYVRLSRGRFRKGDLTPDKRAAFETLHECLLTVGQLMSPIAPFFAEWLYQNLTEHQRESQPETPESAHLTLLAEPNSAVIDLDLEARMALAQQVCSLGHALRKKAAVKVRQPLPRLLVPVLTDRAAEDLRRVADLIAAELNVKDVQAVSAREASLVVKSAKPNFKTVGKRFGPRLKAATAAIQALTREQIEALETAGQLTVDVDGTPEVLSPTDVEIRTEDVPGYASATENGVTVALDLTITEELRLEGLARELVNRLQNLRKDVGLEVQDRIRVRLSDAQPDLNLAVAAFGDVVRAEVQAVVLDVVKEIEGETALEFDDYTVPVQLEVVG